MYLRAAPPEWASLRGAAAFAYEKSTVRRSNLPLKFECSKAAIFRVYYDEGDCFGVHDTSVTLMLLRRAMTYQLGKERVPVKFSEGGLVIQP